MIDKREREMCVRERCGNEGEKNTRITTDDDDSSRHRARITRSFILINPS